MKKVTFLFTALILFIGMFSIVQSCQKEEVEPQEQTTYPFKVTPINQNSVNINSKLTNTINKVSDLITEKTQTKSVYSEIYDFYIITEKGNYIESSDGKYHSYTFPIVRRNDIGKIENILFSLQEDGKYKVVLISYDLTQEELEDYNSRGSVDISNKITYTAILDESLVDSTLKVVTTNCFWVITSWCTEGICPGGIDLDGKRCPYYAEKIDVYCISGGGSGSYEDYYNLDYSTFSETDNTSSGSGGSSTGNTMPAPEATTITICNDCIGFDELALKGFIYSLPSDTRAWFTATENLTFQSQTNSFLIKNNFSDEARAFAKEVVNIFSDNTLTEAQKIEKFNTAHDLYDPQLPITLTKEQCEAKIKHYAHQFNIWGNPEFGSYLESLLPLENTYNQEDYYKLYETIREKKKDLLYDYFRAIFTAVVESFEPIIEMALWEVGGGMALKVLGKLPAKYISAPILNVINRLKAPASTAFNKLKHAKKFGIKSYKELGNTFKELGLSLSKEGVERHHLIEKRFVTQMKSKLGENTDDWLSIVVDKGKVGSEHYNFTQAWQKAIGIDGKAGTTGYHTDNVSFDIIIKTAKDIYKDYPEILKALGI